MKTPPPSCFPGPAWLFHLLLSPACLQVCWLHFFPLLLFLPCNIFYPLLNTLFHQCCHLGWGPQSCPSVGLFWNCLEPSGTGCAWSGSALAPHHGAHPRAPWQCLGTTTQYTLWEAGTRNLKGTKRTTAAASYNLQQPRLIWFMLV